MAASTHTGQAAERATPTRPLWQHAGLLLLILVALLPVVGTDSAFVTDESFVVIQLDTIEETGGWVLPHPLQSVDPSGDAFPLHGATRYEAGYTLYGKHQALVYLYLPVHRAAGLVGLMALSVAGTWVAALTAAGLARRIRRGSEWAALWLVGLASPLFFDSYLIHAHTIGAALAGLAALLTWAFLDRERIRTGMAVIAAVFAVALLRTEGVLLAGALGAATGLVGLWRRRVGVMALGVATIVAGAAAMLVDRFRMDVPGGGAPVELQAATSSSASFLRERVTSISYTWLMPGYRGGTLAEVLTLVGAALVIAGAVVVRHRPDDEGAIVVPLAGAAILSVRAVLEWGPVPGLVPAFCVGVVGLVLLRGEVARSPVTRYLLVASGLYAAGVGLTQYAVGGHTEWGGRYFALAVPFVGAVSAASLHAARRELPRRAAKALTGTLVVATLAIGWLAVSTLHSAHERNRGRSDGVLAAAANLPRSGGEPPVVLTEDDQIPRLARGRHDEARFLLTRPSTVHRYLTRLAAEGVDDILVVSVDPGETLDEIPDEYEVVGPVRPHDLQWESGGGLIRLHRQTP